MTRAAPTVAEALAAGRAALMRAAWDEARERFEEALAVAVTPEALEGLGTAARGQLDADTALDAHERAYRLARELDDTPAAARIALELVLDSANFRGAAEANGWIERAGHLLERVPFGASHGLHAYLRAHMALKVGRDPETARAIAAETAAFARAAGSVEGEMICLALEGLALVTAGEVSEGMRRLDEATAAAVAGEIQDVRIAEVVCCHLIDACKRVRDFDRAAEWCRRVEEISSRFGDAEMFATCRTYYADVLVWRGEWGEAEETLTAACRDLAAIRRKALEGLARLAELRRRQGRVPEALALLAEAEGHLDTLLVGAELALDRGDALTAADDGERYLRRVGEADRLARVDALELLVRARIALGEAEAAGRAAAELDEIAALAGTPPLRAAALLARGRVAAPGDPAAARVALEDAADLFAAAGARYDAARARLELAAVLRELGRDDAASRVHEDARAALAVLGVETPAPRPERGLLTRREHEVLRLVAQGRSNDEIAGELVLSVRTVERHVENVYGKIGVSGRTARAAATAWALAHGAA